MGTFLFLWAGYYQDIPKFLMHTVLFCRSFVTRQAARSSQGELLVTIVPSLVQAGHRTQAVASNPAVLAWRAGAAGDSGLFLTPMFPEHPIRTL